MLHGDSLSSCLHETGLTSPDFTDTSGATVIAKRNMESLPVPQSRRRPRAAESPQQRSCAVLVPPRRT